MKRDSEATEKEPAHSCGIESASAQLRGSESVFGIRFDILKEPTRPVGKPARIQGPATLAGPVARKQGLAGRGEIAHVLRQGLARRTGGPAEHVGGPDGDEENPIK